MNLTHTVNNIYLKYLHALTISSTESVETMEMTQWKHIHSFRSTHCNLKRKFTSQTLMSLCAVNSWGLHVLK
jgi:hypothetical protein